MSPALPSPWKIIFPAANPRDCRLAHSTDNTRSIPPPNSSACLEKMQQDSDLSVPIKIPTLTQHRLCWIKDCKKCDLWILGFLDLGEKAPQCNGLECEVPEDRDAPTPPSAAHPQVPPCSATSSPTTAILTLISLHLHPFNT